jgi:hypothetical protein
VSVADHEAAKDEAPSTGGGCSGIIDIVANGAVRVVDVGLSAESSDSRLPVPWKRLVFAVHVCAGRF